MPYITRERRRTLEGSPAATLVENTGELTYMLQQQVASYIGVHGLSYSTLAEVLGAIEGLKFDLQRRILDPYENVKQIENGDTWPLELIAQARRGRE